ncbi:hypothetical protein DL96DRAFT_1726652 [Flagelloscypha sp. PMI_526]|nr:hypothetical protein DL96DRAFT_1726652 [Flagelloscypha sp. PMI_526]
MPALALPSFFHSNSLRSVSWGHNLNARDIDHLQVRNVPRAEVTVDVNELNSIQAAINEVFGSLTGADGVLTALVNDVSGTTLDIPHIQSDGSAFQAIANKITSDLNNVLPRVQGAFTGSASAAINAAVSSIHAGLNDFQAVVSQIEASLSQATDTFRQTEADASNAFGKRQFSSAVLNDAVGRARAALQKIRDGLGQIQGSLQAATSDFNSAENSGGSIFSGLLSADTTDTSGAASDSTSNSTSSDGFARWAPIVVGLLAANLFITLVLLLVGILNCVRRGKASRSYQPIKEIDSERFVGRPSFKEDQRYSD